MAIGSLRTEDRDDKTPGFTIGSTFPSLIPRFLRSYGVWVALVGLFFYGLLTVRNFTTGGNVTSFLTSVAPLIIAALGQTFVIAVGGLDLSVGMLMGLVGVLSVGLMVRSDASFLPVVLLVLCLALAVGTFNGFMIARTGMSPIILTFGMLFVLEGASYLYSDTSIGPAPPILRGLVGHTVGGVPIIATPLWVLLSVLAGVTLARTRLGQHIRAVGSNEKSALKAGIPVGGVRVAAYVLSALSGGIAGLLLASRLGAGYPLAGQGMELNAIVAVLVGGTPYGGGRASIAGSVGGALLISLFGDVLNLSAVPPYVQQVAVGTFTVAAIALYSARRRRYV